MNLLPAVHSGASRRALPRASHQPVQASSPGQANTPVTARVCLLVYALTGTLLTPLPLFAASPGLPLTEDFSSTELRDATLTNADWSTEEQAAYLAWSTRRQLPTFSASGTAVGSETDNTFSVKLGDLDGDGGIDLVVGNGIGQSNKLYRSFSYLGGGAALSTTVNTGEAVNRVILTATETVNTATVPDAPFILSATPGDAEVSIAFIPPASDGGSAITGYTATSSPGGFTSTGCTTSPCAVTGLTNGTSYSFTMVATNALGDSVASNAKLATPATVPDAPFILSATPGDAEVSIAFIPPASDGGSAIIDYTASCSPGPVTTSGGGSPLTVTGLVNDQLYSCSVSARNANGSGPASSSLTVIPGTETSADLAISKTNGTNFVSGGQPTTYTIVVSNAGPAGAAAAQVTDTLDAAFSLASWTCSGQNGGECSASGNGNIDTLVDLPPGSSVTFLLTATVAAEPETSVSNIAAVTPPDGISDDNLDNNVASDGPDSIGVFRNGFE